MAIHDAGMFTVKGINRLKILQYSYLCRHYWSGDGNDLPFKKFSANSETRNRIM